MARSFKKGQEVKIIGGPHTGKKATFVMWDKTPTQIIVKIDGVMGTRGVHIDHVSNKT